MMQSPEERVLEACYQVAQAHQLIRKIENDWGWRYQEVYMYLNDGFILEEHDDMLLLSFDVLTYSLGTQTDMEQIHWHNSELDRAEQDKLAAENAERTILSNLKILDAEVATWKEIGKVYGMPGKPQLINAILTGKWEAKTREIMKQTGYGHEEAAIFRILRRDIP